MSETIKWIEDEKLPPCPCCDSKEISTNRYLGNLFLTSCQDCGTRFSAGTTKKESEMKWDDVAGLVKRARERMYASENS